MEALMLTQLEWPLLLEKLAGQAQTVEGREQCLDLPLNLTASAITDRWQLVEPLRDLIRGGYRPPIGDLPVMADVFRSIKVGQILPGEAFRAIYILLTTTKNIHRFTTDFRAKCSTLDRVHRAIYPLPKLMQAIEQAISPEGEILDDASAELSRIRKAKVNLRRRIEQAIKQLLVDNQIETYLQDKFFTVRAERYVIPMRLDGRGRIKGSIYDTSDSGQTLYIEPTAIAPLNEELLELDLSEKLEILRIFKELTALCATEMEILQTNYQQLIFLDFLTAQASLAHDMDAVSVELVKTPGIQLHAARHPLIRTPKGEWAVANDIVLNPDQRSLVVSGPNAGGKTVVLKTVGLVHLMAKAGLLLPCKRESALFLYEDISLAMGDAQNLTANLSTFSGHLLTIKPILERAKPTDLVLLDELAIGTEPQTGSAIAQAILERLADQKVTTVATTHFDALKGLPVHDQRFRNGAMEFSKETLKPTYRLLLDVPGQSYGIEVAEQLGLPHSVVERARTLRGAKATSVDQLMESLASARDEAHGEAQRLLEERRSMETQHHHWVQERRALDEARKDAAKKVAAKYEADIDQLKMEFHQTIDALKEQLRLARQQTVASPQAEQQWQELRQKGSQSIDALNSHMNALESNFAIQDIPGQPVEFKDLAVGDEVFVVSIAKAGTITSIQNGTPPNIEVQAGLLKMRPSLNDLRLLLKKGGETAKPKKSKTPSTAPRNAAIPVMIPTATNSCDVRGMDGERAVDQMWQFIDRAVLRGEHVLCVIHGHGTDTLKRAVRMALGKAPYPLNFRPGEQNEGGDGVTIIGLDH